MSFLSYLCIFMFQIHGVLLGGILYAKPDEHNK